MPDATIDGVVVQRMAPKGHELVIGMVNDPTFGPIMMVGFGGVTVELFGDVAHSPAPVDEAEAERMIRSLRSAPLLTGFRGSKPIDLAPVATLIARLSEAALALCGPDRGDGIQPGDSACGRLGTDDRRRADDAEGLRGQVASPLSL